MATARPYAPRISTDVLTEAALMLRFMRKPKGMETERLPCRIVVYGDLPIGVRLAFYSSRSVKIVRCVNVAFDYLGSGGGFSIQCHIGAAGVSRGPRGFAANTAHGRGGGAAAEAA
jgi:hypothetical protein